MSFRWGFILRLSLEAYIELAVGSFINFKIVEVSNLSDTINLFVLILSSFVTLVLPIFIPIWIIRKGNYMNSKDKIHKERWSEAFANLKLHDLSALWYTFAFVLRRILLAIMIVACASFSAG